MMVVYGFCRCSVWPLGRGQPVGRCGTCGERPFVMTMPGTAPAYQHDAAVARFRHEYRREPILRDLAYR